MSRDVNETLANETETRPRRLIFATRPRLRPCKAEIETFFETFNVEQRCTHKFPHSTASKSFLCFNAFMAKSGAQTLMLNSVTNRQTDRETKLSVFVRPGGV